ncbi:ABC transporter ATP-binding protein [Alkalihalobacillus sp. CinArs1]|uniref:ABC transporter ATP-binding protein n=1 Tax=Alkalihalobacillus sp. CinArs1 TaxID=2995314 RepID=UPI0022DD3847|nr:ABC transporter ATP-binding protein [Alkalihalobacillus sp. CinArs1]
MITMIKKTLSIFGKNEQKKLLILFVMMIAAALFETVGIGLIVPFVGIITNPDTVNDIALLRHVYDTLGFTSLNAFIVFSVLIFLAIFILKNAYLLLFHYLQYRLIFNQEMKLSRRLFATYLSMPYTFHLQNNSADLLRNITIEVPKIFQKFLVSAFSLATEILVSICILILLFIVSPIPTITACVLLGTSVFVFFKYLKVKTSYLGIEQQQVNGTMIKWVKQGLGAGKELKVTGKEGFFVNAYGEQGKKLAVNNRTIKLLEYMPRPLMETILITIVLITMILIVFQNLETTQVVSTMALFCMAAFRLLPSINRIITMITLIRYHYPALAIVSEDLKNDNTEPFLEEPSLSHPAADEKVYTKEITLKNVCFRYPNEKYLTVRNVSLTIPIGHAVAFIGESGAGKTTIVDLILGLLTPETGEILIDGKPVLEEKGIFQQKVGYIPQSIFLSDDSIRNNVAFGINVEYIQDEAVWRALEQAQLKEFVLSLPDKLNTRVGERGVKLSGGQRQRIGIARALYHDPEILFMDEATSALDSGTEKEIMRAIDLLKGQKTLIIIAHRLSTIENCDIVFEMHGGELTSSTLDQVRA